MRKKKSFVLVAVLAAVLSVVCLAVILLGGAGVGIDIGKNTESAVPGAGNASHAHSFENGKTCVVCGVVSDEYLKFSLNKDGTYTITGHNFNKTTAYESFGKARLSLETYWIIEVDVLKLPDTYNGKPVTSIGNSAFKMSDGFEKLYLPASITGEN